MVSTTIIAEIPFGFLLEPAIKYDAKEKMNEIPGKFKLDLES